MSEGSPTARPRVLFVADHFGYAGGVIHGGTSYYLNVLPRLRERGIEVQCCFLRESHVAAKQLEAKGIAVHFLDSGKWNPFLTDRIERVARAMRANVLHVANMKAAALSRIVARRIGAALFIHSHDMNVPPLVARLAYRFLRTPGERGLAVSAAAADLMPLAYGIPRSAVAVLPNALDVEALQSVPRMALPSGVPAQGRRIAWAGRLHEVKGPLRMIRAMSAVVAAVPDARLVMAGDGPQRQACEQLIAELGLQGVVHLIGQRDDLPQVFRHVELLCITSHNEGFSLVAAEAGVAGLPVVAYAVGGLGEVVEDGRTGLLVADGDEPALVAALSGLLLDEPRRAAMGAHAAVRVRRFALGEHVQRLATAYDLALSEEGARRSA